MNLTGGNRENRAGVSFSVFLCFLLFEFLRKANHARFLLRTKERTMAKAKASRAKKTNETNADLATVGGVAAGAAVGSLLGPLGAAVGSLVGGVAGRNAGKANWKSSRTTMKKAAA